MGREFPETWLLAYFGFLNPGKGGEVLMPVVLAGAGARSGKPAWFLMVGGKIGSSDPTNEAYLAHVEQLIDDLGIADRVCWSGFTANDQVFREPADRRLRRPAVPGGRFFTARQPDGGAGAWPADRQHAAPGERIRSR